MSTVVVAGALTGLGVWMMWSGWSPVREPLAAVLARLGQVGIVAEAPSRGNLDARVGAWARRIRIVDRAVVGMRSDLRVLRRSPDEQAAQIVAYASLGVLWGPVVVAGGWLVGFRFPLAVPVWLALIGGVIGALVPLRSVRNAALVQRKAFSHALAAFCDVTGMCLAAGRGVESALETAAGAGDGWPFQELRGALRSGYVRGDTPWEALMRLGTETDIGDLSELAAALSLAGEEGAAVRETVRSKAKAIRERLTADAERASAGATERMGVPATLLLLGFIVFLGYPALAVLFQ